MAVKQLIVEVEGAAALGPYWQTIVTGYLENIIRFEYFFFSFLCACNDIDKNLFSFWVFVCVEGNSGNIIVMLM